MTEWTAADTVKKYIELRDFVQEENKAHAARMKQYTDAMEILEGVAAALMKTTKQTSLSTEHGTAFPVPKSRVTMEDQDKFMNFVREKQAWSFLTKHVVASEVDDWMEKNEGKPPPGIKVESWTAIQFRRS